MTNNYNIIIQANNVGVGKYTVILPSRDMHIYNHIHS